MKDDRGLAGLAFHEIESVRVVEFCPSPDRSGAASEVHVVMRASGMTCPLVLKFAHASALDELAAILRRYRALVWPQTG
jgi:hypothetical protein